MISSLGKTERDIEEMEELINDMIIKTIISVEPLLWNGIEMYL
jgi:hypothetical protein